MPQQGSPRKHVAQRMCVACRQKFDKRRLTRIVRTPDGAIVIDSSGKRNGRGAYLCDDRACWERALARNLLNAALKTALTVDDKELLQTYMVEKLAARITRP